MLVSSVDPRDQTGGHPSQLPRLLPRCPRCGRGTRDHRSRRLRDFGVGRDRATRQNLRALRLRPAQRSGPGPTSRQRPQRAVESPWSRHVRVSSGNRFVQGSEWTCVSIEVTLARIKRCRIAATVALAAIAIGAHSADHPRLPYASIRVVAPLRPRPTIQQEATRASPCAGSRRAERIPRFLRGAPAARRSGRPLEVADRTKSASSPVGRVPVQGQRPSAVPSSGASSPRHPLLLSSRATMPSQRFIIRSCHNDAPDKDAPAPT